MQPCRTGMRSDRTEQARVRLPTLSLLLYAVAGGSNLDTDSACAVLFAAITLISTTVWNSNLYDNLCDNMARVRITLGLATNIDF
jgi:hypothetical protein